MKKITIGERIIFAEREQANIQKELDFCISVKRGAIDPREHFAYLLEKSVFTGYKFDEDEQWEYENYYAYKMTKLEFIIKRQYEIREFAINNYKKAVAKYCNIDRKINSLRAEILRRARIIKTAKKRHRISYFVAKNISGRVNRPSFVFSVGVGEALVEGIRSGVTSKGVYMTQSERLKDILENG